MGGGERRGCEIAEGVRCRRCGGGRTGRLHRWGARRESGFEQVKRREDYKIRE